MVAPLFTSTMQLKHTTTSQHETDSQNSMRQIFNTALVASRFNAAKDASTEILQLVNTPAFEAILSAVDALAKKEGITREIAAEKVILTFRNLDSAWIGYLMREGFRQTHLN